MRKIKNRIRNRSTLVVFLCLVFVIPVSMAIFAIPMETLFPVAASPVDTSDDLIKEANDLIKASDTSVAKATTAIDEIGKIKTELAKAQDLKKASDASIKTLDDLNDFLGDNAAKAVTDFTDASTELTDQEKKYDPLAAKLKALPTSTAIDTAVKGLTEQKKKAGDKNTTLAAAKDGLKDPVSGVIKSEDAVITDFTVQLNAINKLNNNVDALLKALPDQLPQLVSINASLTTFENAFAPLQTQLNKLITTPAAPSGDLKTVRGLLASILTTKVASWIDTLTADLKTTNKDLVDLRLALDKDLQANSITAVKTLDDTGEKEEVLKTIFNGVTDVGDKTDTKPIKAAAADLEVQLKELDTRIGYVKEGLAGDFKNFVNDFVSLYYFTDVQNLMMVLNPRTTVLRDVAGLKVAAANSRTAVVQATTEVNAAQGTVSGLQVAKRNLVNDLADAQNAFDTSSRSLADAKRRLSHFGTDDPKRRAPQEKVDDLTEKNNADKLSWTR